MPHFPFNLNFLLLFSVIFRASWRMNGWSASDPCWMDAVCAEGQQSLTQEGRGRVEYSFYRSVVTSASKHLWLQRRRQELVLNVLSVDG